MASTERGTEKIFDFKENFRIYSVTARGDDNYYYHKNNMNSQLRYGVILVTNKDIKGEYIEIYLQGNREEDNRAHSQNQDASKCSYRGSIKLNGTLFEDTLFIIRETEYKNFLVTFWPENQYDEQVPHKVITPTDYLINLSKAGYPIDPNIVAGEMHKEFLKLTKEAGIKHFKADVFMAVWDKKVKEDMGLKIENLKEEVDAAKEDSYAAAEQRYVAEEETALAKEETAVEKSARKLAEEGQAVAEAKLLAIKMNEKKAYTTSAETGRNSVRHAEVYTLVKSEIVTQFGKPRIEITLEDSFGSITTSWNNWDQIPGRLRDKLNQSDSLVGRKIQYDTWGGFGPEWFNNLYLVE
jgi:hypothetical protein|tara:strand:+ start:1407 stop:2465 length:1059 start_codon:yes stop_codon:yes gene_type:complete